MTMLWAANQEVHSLFRFVESLQMKTIRQEKRGIYNLRTGHSRMLDYQQRINLGHTSEYQFRYEL
jgi:hypothetical protein